MREPSKALDAGLSDSSGEQPAIEANGSVSWSTDERAKATGRQRSPTTRQAIMTAVLAMLEEDDYRAISIERIAARARVSKHSIYRWWSSKGEVVLEAFIAHALQRAAQPRSSEDALADLEHFIASACQSWHDPFFAKGLRGLCLEMTFDAALRRRFHDTFLGSRKALVAAIIRRGIAQGRFKPVVGVDSIVDAIFGFVWLDVQFSDAPPAPATTTIRLMQLLGPLLGVARPATVD